MGELSDTRRHIDGSSDAHVDDVDATEDHDEDVPPDGGYGWTVTACVFLINAHTWGVSSAWGVFLARFLSHTTFPGATQLQYALIGGLSISQSLTSSPVVGWCNEKLGTRLSLLIGTALVSTAMLTSSFATESWQLFLTQGACFGYGMGFLYITATAILPQWFSNRRSLAVGLASSGAGIGGLIYNLAAGAGIEHLGWRWTYVVLAISTLVVNLACSMLLKDRNKLVRPHRQRFSSFFRELAHLSTWLIIAWGWLTELGYIVLLYSLPNYAASIGLSSRQGSVVGAMLNLGLAVGRPATGYLSDRFGRINVAAIMTALCGLFCLAIWVPAKSYGVLLLFALVSGSVTGVFWGTVIPVTVEVVGLRRLPVVYGAICLPLVLPTTFAEAIALQMVSAYGYYSAQVFVGCAYVAGAASVWGLRAWKIRELEEQEDEADEERARGPGSSTGLRRRGRGWLTPRRLVTLRRV